MLKGIIFGERYRLEDLIGQGGMSVVYRAVDIRTGHSVAVKILKSEFNGDKEFLERFQREAQAASLMNHHNLVNLLDVGVEGEYRYLVLEYVKGHTLKEHIQKKGRLNYQTSIQITIRILSALQHAHMNGIIHRDIKPQNILIHEDGHVKVADFGIARMANAFTLGKGDAVVGSVHYSSPEQASGGKAEAASDLYSTGVVLYEMLTGRVPFVGDSPVAIAMQHVKDPPPPIEQYAPETPPALCAVVMKALEKDPSRRFHSAREMADALIMAREGTLNPDSLHISAEMMNRGEKENEPVQAAPSPENELPEPNNGTLDREINRPKKRLRKMVFGLILLIILGLIAAGLIVGINALQKVEAPYLIGCSSEEARQITEDCHLVWLEKSIPSDTIPAGQVISQQPAFEEMMHNGDTLIGYVSAGPEKAAYMPDLIGQDGETARALLKERGVEVVLERGTSPMPVGTVVNQTPAAGSELGQVAEVTLYISGGSAIVPSLIGLTKEEAAQALTDAGLEKGAISYTEVPADQVGTVVAQDLPAGSSAVQGGIVSMTVGVESQPFQCEIPLHIPAGEKEAILRVYLVRNGGEILKYQTKVAAGKDFDAVIPLTSSTGGECICRIMLEDVLYEELTVNMK